MKEKNENKLDQLFKAGLSGPEDHFAFREEDWDAMEDLLDKKSGKKAGFFRIMYNASGIAALLLLSLGLYFYSRNDETDPTKLQSKVNKIEPKAGEGQSKAALANQGKVGDTLYSKTNDLAASASAGQKNDVQQSKKDTIYNKANNVAVNNKANSSKGSRDTLYNKANNIAVNNKANTHKALKMKAKRVDTLYNKINNIAQSNKPKAPKNNKAIVPDDNTMQLANNGVPTVTQATKDKVAQVDTLYNASKVASAGNQATNNLADNKKPEAAADKAAELEAKKQMAIVKASALKNRPQFSISVLAASDANAVNSFGRSQTGSNYGLQLSLRLTRKLTISTGAAYAIKPYSTNYASYSSPTYNPSISPTNIQANCKVLDIPLNVSYQLFAKGSNAIALGTGLSSYFMLKENYRFDYSAESGWKPYNLEVKNQNTHLFSVLNINANYQRRINSKFSAVIQPYMKLPLTGIGNGRVDLKSTGVALGVNWALGSR